MKLLGPSYTPEEILNHPRHQAALQTVTSLVGQLRAITNIDEGYDFQRTLLAHRLAVEEDRGRFKQAMRRIRQHKQPDASRPQPQSGRDLNDLRTWRLEYDLCERVARQLMCVGDALAWRVFGFQRRNILVRSRNDGPGPLAGKAGLARELAEIESAWRDDRQFALMHDLTNCLRIGDVTRFTDEGPRTIELKTNPNRRIPRAQARRLEEMERALRGVGPLPGPDQMARLCDLAVPFKTHLDLLRTGTERAASEGVFAAKVPGNRAMLVIDMIACAARGLDPDQHGSIIDRKYGAARRRAGIANGLEWNVGALSIDRTGRDPARVPFASYPLHSAACARLIGDYTVFAIETNAQALTAALSGAGLDAEWVRAATDGELTPGEVLIEMKAKTGWPIGNRGTSIEWSRTLQLRRFELDRYLVEMVEQDTWIEGIRYLLHQYDLEGRPWPTYQDEYLTWA